MEGDKDGSKEFSRTSKKTLMQDFGMKIEYPKNSRESCSDLLKIIRYRSDFFPTNVYSIAQSRGSEPLFSIFI